MLVLLSILLAIAPLTTQQDEGDRQAIQALRRADVRATKAFDVDALVALWSDEIVSMAPGQAPVVGKAANRAQLEKARAQARGLVTIDYIQDWRELSINGDHAYEWGIFTSVFRVAPDAEPIRQRHNVLRVLRRERDGWKILRTIWNEHPAK